MIRVYFDWNVYSSLRTTSSECFSEIFNCIKENDSSILLVYSPAHLQDLKRSYFQSELGKIETEKDLTFLGELTKNHCLGYDIKEKIVHPYIKDPYEYFREIFIDSELNDPFDFDNIFDQNDPLRKIWQSYWELLGSIPTGINFQDLEKMPAQYQTFSDVLKTTKEKNTLESLIKDITFLLQHPSEFEKMFKNIRTSTNKDLKIDSDITKTEDPFSYIDNILLKNHIQKNFFDLTSEIIKNSNKKSSRFDYFVNYYLQLDMFGFYQDKKISNLIDDATHSFYGAHTDIFVTDDRNTNKKSKVLYKQLNISTKVISSNEFCTTIKMLKSNSSQGNFADQLNQMIESSVLLLDTADDDFNPSKVFQIEPLFLDFFNRLQFSTYAKSQALIIYKKQDNYSNLMFWSEIKAIVNKLFKYLGSDSFNKSEFTEIEESDITDNKWTGRYWQYQESEIILNYIDYPLGLTLKIEFNEPNR